MADNTPSGVSAFYPYGFARTIILAVTARMPGPRPAISAPWCRSSGRAHGADNAASVTRFVERRRSSAVARRHPSDRPAAGTIASRPLEQGSR